MNPFITSARKLIYRNGVNVVFTRVQEGVYNSDTGTVTNTETTKTVKAYPENVTVNQYNFPNLINKEVVKYSVVSADLGYKPEPTDRITVNGSVLSIVKVQDVVARNESVIYFVFAVKG